MSGDVPLAPVLRPMGVGEVIDAGFGLARHNYKFLLRTAAWAIIPGFVLAAVADLISPVPNLGSIPMVVAVTISSIAVALACGSIVDPDLFPIGNQPGALYRATLARLPSLIGISLLAAILVVPLLIIVPLGVFLGVRWSMVFFAVIVDRRGPIPALRESWQLTRGSFWHTFGVLLVAAMLGGVFSYIVDGLFLAIGVILQLLLNSSTALEIVTNLANGLSALLVTPFTTAINVMLFFELKSRAGGFDLLLRARQLRSAE